MNPSENSRLTPTRDSLVVFNHSDPLSFLPETQFIFFN